MWPTKTELDQTWRSLAPKRRLVVIIGLILAAASLLAAVAIWNEQFMVTVPTGGGTLTEGVSGSPRFINPILAISDADRDLTALVYSGLLRPDEHGQLIPDLAASYQISPDGRTYTFTLKDNLVWPDGAPLTADDVVFTVNTALDPAIKSPRRGAWEGVQIQKLNDRQVQFTLKQSYAGFLENTTLGLLPKHRWQNIRPEEFSFSALNVEGLGSGPYQIKSITKDRAGIPSAYTLVPFKHFALGRPYIDKLIIRFYANDEALVTAYDQGEVANIAAAAPALARRAAAAGRLIIAAPLPRIFAVFFNQNQAPVFTYHEVRQALDLAIDKNQIVDDVLAGYGEVLDGPLPPATTTVVASMTTATTSRLAAAAALLVKNGWQKNDQGIYQKKTKKETVLLRFALATSNVPELKQAGEILAATWRALGAEVNLQVFEIGDLNQQLIRPRKYEALLFGEIIGREPDLFPFWHSSQRLDPGLNVAMYTNISVDKALETARTTTDLALRQQANETFQTIIRADAPAVFLYTPYFLYLVPKAVKGIAIGPVATPAERFATIYQWYLDTDRVWQKL